MRVAIGSDDAGYPLKEVIASFLRDGGVKVVDFSPDKCVIDYPDVAFPMAEAVVQGQFERGILICGTGIGMSISANKVPGVRAALCHDVYSAERARKSNDAQILTMGARVIGPELAKSIVSAWLQSEFEDGRSTRKVQKITVNEQKMQGGYLSHHEKTSR